MKFKNRQKKLFSLIVENYNKDASLRCELVDGRGQIYLYDVISDNFGIGPKDFTRALSELDGAPVDLYINSPGGDVFDGRAIANILKRYSGEIVAHTDGICASAATTVACGADRRVMGEGTRFMIHNAWTLAIGNQFELQDVISLLENLDTDIAGDYAQLTGFSEEKIMDFMKAETFFSAEECLENGLCDEITKSASEDPEKEDATDASINQNLQRLQRFAAMLEKVG